MKTFSKFSNLSGREFFIATSFLLLFFIFENFLIDFFLQKTTLFPRTYFYFKLILVIIFFVSNFSSGFLLIKIKEDIILISAVLLMFCSTFLINLLKLSPIELTFWLIIPYTVAMGLIPTAILNYLNSRMELIERQKQMSNILIITFIALILSFYTFFIKYEFYIILNFILTVIFLYFLLKMKKRELKKR